MKSYDIDKDYGWGDKYLKESKYQMKMEKISDEHLDKYFAKSKKYNYEINEPGYFVTSKPTIKPIKKAEITPQPIKPAINIEPTQPMPSKDEGVLLDGSQMAMALIELLSKPENLAEIKGMDKHQLTAWVAKNLNQPIITATQKKNGKTEFKKTELQKPTPEQLAKFVQDFIQV